MVRKSRTKRPEIYTRVKKYKLQALKSVSLIDPIDTLIAPETLALLHGFAATFFQSYTKILSRCYLIPYNVTSNGRLDPPSTNRLRIHSFFLLLQCLSMVHKMAVSGYRIFGGDSGTTAVDIHTFMCITSFLAHFAPLTVSLSALFKNEETMGNVNNWDMILNFISQGREADFGPRRVGCAWNTEATLVVTSVLAMTTCCGAAISFFGFIVDAIPVSYLSTAEALGFDPVSFIGGPRILWKLLFWPFEFLTYTPPMCVAGWAGTINEVTVIVTKECLDRLRLGEII